ncbi:hypothetical protein SISNIDRAFT_415108, partial [Sistotremastrum niveocremeum HHB9708]
MSLSVSSKDLFTVPKLQENGGNWVLYKASIESIITARGYEEHLDGTVTIPKPPPANPPPSETDLATYRKQSNQYKKERETVKSIIRGSLPDSLQIKTLTAVSAHDMWKIVCSQYMDQSQRTKVSIFYAMGDIRCSDSEDPRTTLNTLSRLREDYAAAGGTIEDEMYTAIIMRAMP